MRLQAVLKADIDTALGSISQAVTSANLLQSTVDETSAKVKEIGIFIRLSSAMARWGWVVVILIGITMMSKMAAGYMAIIMG